MNRNMYKETIKAFKKLLKYNSMLTAEEWNSHARKNDLFSSTTLIAKEEVNNFEQVKQKHMPIINLFRKRLGVLALQMIK